MRAVILAAALVALFHRAPAAASPTGASKSPTLSCSPAVLVPGDDLAWRMSVSLSNPLSVPLMVDSGAIVVEDLSDNALNADRVSAQPLGRLGDVLRTVSPGAAREARWAAPALVDTGRLTLELDAHDSLGTAYHLTASVALAPGSYSEEHPSEILTVDGKRVEVIYVAPEDSVRPAPGVLLVHGHAHYARQMLRVARTLHRAGFAVMLVSQPGYGRSEGPPDLMGPHTIAAASAAMDRLAREPGVDPGRLGAWGVSRGATVVTLLMTRRGDVRAGISQAGIYDLWAAYRGTAFDGIRANIASEAGRDSAAWRARSAAYSAKALRGRLLILHGEGDRNVPVEQAKAFYGQLKALGASVDAEIFPASEHELPRDQVAARAIGFLTDALRPKAAASH